MKELTLEEKIMLYVASKDINHMWHNHATHISKDMDIPLSTTTCILNRLAKEGILKNRADGKLVYYDFPTIEIQEKVKHALESLKEAYSMIL